jgi:c(7)-type cytochrome triheme protein
MTLQRVATLLIFGLITISGAVEGKTINFKMKNAEPVVFNHDFHLAKYNKNCRTCHNTLFNLNQRKHVTMVEMENGKSCGACHNGIKAFSVAAEKSCSSCHKGKPRTITFKVKGASEVSFNHGSHLSRVNGNCKSCHNSTIITGKVTPVTMAQMEKGKTCGACHNGKTAFTVAGSCDKCHKGFKPKDIGFKTDAGDVTFSHDIHTGMYSCQDCHTGIFKFKAGANKATMAEMEQGKSCGTCHDGSTGFSVKGDCQKCHKM